jgi:hypothetical protein
MSKAVMSKADGSIADPRVADAGTKFDPVIYRGARHGFIKVDVRNRDQLKEILPDLWDRDLTAALGQPLAKTRAGTP